MVSINPANTLKDSMMEFDEDKMKLLERKLKLIDIANERLKNSAVENNLQQAARAEQNKRFSTVVVVNPEQT